MLNNDIVTGEEERRAIQRRIENEARRLSELIGDVLTISKLESNEGAGERARFDLGELVGEAAAAVSPMKDDTRISIETELAGIACRADKRHIYELAVNLIENAVKYNKPGGKVFVSLREAEGEAVLTVRDTGIGIPPEYQSRVFERFFRVDYGRNKKTGGTGLGLSIVKHIAGIYGGKINLQSKKGEGTVIEVALPIIE